MTITATSAGCSARLELGAAPVVKPAELEAATHQFTKVRLVNMNFRI